MHELNVNNCQPPQGPMVAIITFIIWSISRYLDQVDTTCQSQHKARILPKENQTLVIRRSRDLSSCFLPNASLMGLYTLLPFLLLPTSLKVGIVWSHFGKGTQSLQMCSACFVSLLQNSWKWANYKKYRNLLPSILKLNSSQLNSLYRAASVFLLCISTLQYRRTREVMINIKQNAKLIFL